MCILWKLNIKGNKKYHTEIRLGDKSNSTHKYAEAIIPLIERMLKRPEFLKTCKDDFSETQREKRKNQIVKKRKK